MKYLLLLVVVALTVNFGCGKKNDSSYDRDYSYYDYQDDRYNPYNHNQQQLPGAYHQNQGFIYCPQTGSMYDPQSFFSGCLNSNGPGIVNQGMLYNPTYFRDYVLQQYYMYGGGQSFEAWFCSIFGGTGGTGAGFYQGNQGYAGNFCGNNGFFNGGYNAYNGGSWNGGFVNGQIHFSW